ncbi:MAG: hypothetical protein U0X91_27530 [Spirosomataceae bacterium]
MRIIISIGLLVLSLGASGQAGKKPVQPADNPQKQESSLKVLRRAPESYMVWQVKHLSEFVARFNYERLPNGQPFTDSSRRVYPREQYVRMLFNEDDPRFRKNKSAAATFYTLQVEEFINAVTEQRIKIPAQASLEAIAKIRVTYNNQPDTLTVRLKKFYTTDSASYWQVIQIQRPHLLRDTLRSACPDSIKRLDFPPNAHEVSFLPLLRGLNDYKSFCSFTSPAVHPSTDWQRTEAAFQKGLLQAEAVVSTTIYVPVGTEWLLELNEFVREKDNSGWLITNLIHRSPKTQPTK